MTPKEEARSATAPQRPGVRSQPPQEAQRDPDTRSTDGSPLQAEALPSLSHTPTDKPRTSRCMHNGPLRSRVRPVDRVPLGTSDLAGASSSMYIRVGEVLPAVRHSRLLASFWRSRRAHLRSTADGRQWRTNTQMCPTPWARPSARETRTLPQSLPRLAIRLQILQVCIAPNTHSAASRTGISHLKTS